MLTALSTQISVLAAEAPAPIGNPDVIVSTHSRTGTTIVFSAFVILILMLLARRIPAADVIAMTVLFLSILVVVSTSGPLLAFGEQVRDFIRSLTSESGNAEFFAGGVLTLILIAGLIWAIVVWRRRNSLGSILAVIILSAMVSTTPGIQEIAVWYADNVAVRAMRIFW